MNGVSVRPIVDGGVSINEDLLTTASRMYSSLFRGFPGFPRFEIPGRSAVRCLLICSLGTTLEKFAGV